ncbi:MAG: hypothetical protein JW744_05280 [Candidatus Diapherotrites archaeon]|uniref:Transcription regulator TrmB N-terminal domain-containing protein n=1 Tax=Candidatus Iainarchaeum sp. TaxID=3101447 RepID=A0A938YPE4_9ARCH|nr:hypothetical protein [Candidatus Diapherotrites archaeon]
MNSTEVNSLLEQLGLTEYESKTLSTLFKLGEAEAPGISRQAQVPKTRVYDVLNKLVEKNLVIEIRGRPKKYRGIEANKALDNLIEAKQAELKQLHERAVEMRDSLTVSAAAKEQSGETVMRVKDRHDFERILAQEIMKAKNSLVGFAEATDKEHVLREAIEKARQRNVNVKILNSFSTDWLKKAAHEARQIEHGLNAFIIDGKKVVLALSDFKREKPEYHFTIFNQHKPIANALQHYFDKQWQLAKK